MAARDRGASAVEFALVLPVLLILISGLVDLGQLLNAKLVIDDAARETVRSLALTGDPAAATAMANTAAAPYTPPAAVLTPCAGAGSVAGATVTARVTLWIHLPGLLGLASTYTVTGKASMTCLQ